MYRSGAILPWLVAGSLAAQDLRSSAPPRGAGATTSAMAVAVLAQEAPAIDGRGEDAVWGRAVPISAFREYDPKDDGDPSERTEARVSFDARYLYVFVRAFDSRPDSIRALLSRRDERTESDYIRLIVDSYHDRRSGFEFMVNPVGVKRDMLLFNDTEEDLGWDAVWDVKTTIDSLGWTAEFRVPFSQLRFPDRDEHTFGLSISREIARRKERIAWPRFNRSVNGIASQLGEVTGIRGIVAQRRLEILPYSVQASESRRVATGWGRKSRLALGADLKYGLASNVTLDATFNPDFGQVEADPSVLNLSAFEQFFEERRPFFVEGTGVLRFNQDCNDGNCTGLFYSRRIGRAPQLGFLSEESGTVPVSSNILGAAKVSGRFQRGLSFGVLDAVTGEERAGKDLMVEPRTNYFVARAQQDLRGGRSALGAMLTLTNRHLDDLSARYLRRQALTGGLDARHQFGKEMYEVQGSLAGSLVRGSREAIARTQRSPVHFYQRPDDDIDFDSTRTSLGGVSADLSLSKRKGFVRFNTGAWYRGPGYEINDVGFMQNVNNMGQSNWLAFIDNTPRAFYRRFQVNFNQWNAWLTDGLNTGHGGNINLNSQLKNLWFVFAGIGGELGSYCGSCLRGGPALYQSPHMFSWLGFEGDSRKPITPSWFVNYNRGDDGRSSGLGINPRLSIRVSSRFSSSLGVSYEKSRSDQQWVGNFGVVGNDTTHYTLAHLDQRTLAVTTRLNYSFSPNLTLQVYGQPFVSAGNYSDWREVAEPRAKAAARRLRRYRSEDPEGFNFKQFRSNTVLRWEYRPGSVLFLVWSQGREQDGIDPGSFRYRRDYKNLFKAYPQNSLLLKASYWLSL